jgi:polyferredoxin
MRDELVTPVGRDTSRNPAVAGRGTIKKIPLGMVRRRPKFSSERNPLRRLIWRLRTDGQFLRSTVQLAFVLLCLWIGIEFHLFVQWGLAGGTAPGVVRPPGVEGFLPISALISLAYVIDTGIVNAIHPSGLAILAAILAVSLLLKKSFCSWLCPIGTLSESLWMFGRKLFRRNITLPRSIDLPLRSIKYLLMGFFLWSILRMSAADLAAFIYSPYNKVADIKMYLFFADITGFALATILVLVALSVVIKNFWCRFLCPYGALLGMVSWLSPFKITRNAPTCIDCGLCTERCPSNIAVHAAKRVWSDECTACLECVDVCPVKDTLVMKTSLSARPLPTWVFGLLVGGIFVAITGLAMVTGHWQNGISRDEYLRRFRSLDAPVYQHFRGQVAPYGPND